MDNTNTTKGPERQTTVKALWRLEKAILDSLDFKEVVQRTVDSILTELQQLQLGYRIIVLALFDKKTNTLKRIAISQTDEGKKALATTPIPFSKIDIPLIAKDNLCVKVFETGISGITSFWPDILCPPFIKEDAIKIQEIVGIKTSLVYPVTGKNEITGIMIFSLVKNTEEISLEEKDLIESFTNIAGLAVQNSQLYSTLEQTTEELRFANEKLKELDKLKDEFVSLASHELRTPMTVIKSYLWMVLQGKVEKGSDKEKEYLGRVYKSTEDLISLVNSMLNVSRIEAGKIIVVPQPEDIVKWTKEFAEDLIPRQQETGITIEVKDPSQPIPQVLVDSAKIREVYTNIIGNSFKFTPKGGKITISFDVKGENVEIHIADNGKGIDKEDMPKLFQKFGQTGKDVLTRPLAQGTGLGLYITKAIVELHGGKIWAESEGEGKGTTFSFSLKIATSKNIEEAKQQAEKTQQIPESATLQPTSI